MSKLSTTSALSLRQLGIAIRVLFAMTVILGVLYPLAILGIGQLVAKDQANGSDVDQAGSTVGSSLIGQDFNGQPQYFWGRPSAADYDGLASGGTNLAPSSPDLVAAIEKRRTELAAANGVAPAQIPSNALTSSGSGLDPHISPEYATLQVHRVAQARGLSDLEVTSVLQQYTQGPTLGFIGQTRVNVLELNLALDALNRP